MNTTATPKIKLSERMTCHLRFTAKHGASHNGVHPTTEALISRGLLEAVEIPDPTVGRMCDVQVTAAGWTWLKENLGMDRPADEGRATMEEALELAHPHNAEVDAVDAWIASRVKLDRERREAGRLTLEEALTDAADFRSAGSLASDRGTNWPEPAPDTTAVEARRATAEPADGAKCDDCEGEGCHWCHWTGKRPADEQPQCEGHNGEDDDLLRGVNIGETTYCDGSCNLRR